MNTWIIWKNSMKGHYLKNKEEYLIHISNLKEALSHGLVLKKGQKNNKFNHEAWLKQYIDMKTGLRTNTKND